MIDDLQALLAQSAELHKHLCPRQVLGVRMGMLAGRLLGLNLPQTSKRLLTLVETDGCFSDGVAVAAGCWVGRRTMRVVDFGKVAATFVDTTTERAVRVYPHPNARERASLHAPDAASRWHSQLAAYQFMSDDELLCFQWVALNESLRAILSIPGHRVNCEMCGEEILNEREILHEGTVLCKACAGLAYYSLVSEPHLQDARG